MIEHFFTCPYCWQNISFLIEEIQGSHTYIEDCEICCNPIEIEYQFFDNQIKNFNCKSIDSQFVFLTKNNSYEKIFFNHLFICYL